MKACISKEPLKKDQRVKFNVQNPNLKTYQTSIYSDQFQTHAQSSQQNSSNFNY